MDVNQSEEQYQLIEKEMTRLQQDLQANIKRMHQYELELNKAKKINLAYSINRKKV